MLEDSRKDIGRFWCLDSRRNGAELMHTNQMKNGIRTAERMMLNFPESGDLTFRAASALERGELKSKGKGVKTIHFNGSDDTIELILRTIISVNQLGVFGAVADLFGELAKDSRGTGEPAENEIWESMVVPTELPNANPISQTDDEVQGNLLHEDEQKFAELPEQQKLIKLSSNAGFYEEYGQRTILHCT